MRVADFGLSKRAKACKTFCGTPQYFAPEVLERQGTVYGVGEYGKAADMWSVGVVLYVLLSGSPAFNNAHLDEDIATGTYRPMKGKKWSRISDDAQDLVRKLLVVNPRQRLTAEQTKQHPWLAETVAATPAGGDSSGESRKRAAPPYAEAGSCSSSSSSSSSSRNGTESGSAAKANKIG